MVVGLVVRTPPQKSAVQIVMPAIVRGHYVRAVFGRPCGGGLGDVDVHV